MFVFERLTKEKNKKTVFPMHQDLFLNKQLFDVQAKSKQV